MNYSKILILFIGFLTVSACCSKKTNVESNSPQEKIENSEKVELIEVADEKKMLETGYKKAHVVYYEEKETPCEYLIQVGDNLLIEPMHELKNEYKIEKLPIWIKYHMQRRMSRCENAQPVEIIGIERRRPLQN